MSDRQKLRPVVPTFVPSPLYLPDELCASGGHRGVVRDRCGRCPGDHGYPVSRVLTPAQPVTSRTDDHRAGSLVVRYCDRLLDWAVVVLCTWTVVYHLCLLLRDR